MVTIKTLIAKEVTNNDDTALLYCTVVIIVIYCDIYKFTAHFKDGEIY